MPAVGYGVLSTVQSTPVSDKIEYLTEFLGGDYKKEEENILPGNIGNSLL